MALPADTLSSCTMCIEIATDGGGTTWTDFSDWLTVLEGPTSSRDTGELPVFGEDKRIVTYGKLGVTDVRIRGVWVDDAATTTTNPFCVAYTAHKTACGGPFAVRWAPAGCATTSQVFTTDLDSAKISELMYPGGDAGSADPLVWEALVHSNDITMATYA
jgi:hypothetical protein